MSLEDDVFFMFNVYPNMNQKTNAKKLSKKLSSDKTQKVLGVFDQDIMIGFGFIKFSIKGSMKNICNLGIVINQMYQSKGYGKKLSGFMIDWAKKNNFKKIWLTVYSDNTKALKLYKSLGFQIEGLFMNNEYFYNVPRHVISMALFIDKNPKNERIILWKRLEKEFALIKR